MASHDFLKPITWNVAFLNEELIAVVLLILRLFQFLKMRGWNGWVTTTLVIFSFEKWYPAELSALGKLSIAFYETAIDEVGTAEFPFPILIQPLRFAFTTILVIIHIFLNFCYGSPEILVRYQNLSKEPNSVKPNSTRESTYQTVFFFLRAV